jgi:threonine dehydrogenase-like Zn-dependent dehydrogenase
LHEKDLVLLTDIFPTGWGSVVQSGFKPGEKIVIFGPGPVELMVAYSAKLQGASKYYY